MATAIYIRVSTDKQEKEGVSLETQKERLIAYCIAKGFGEPKEYMDVGSARTTKKRTNFNRMMDDVKKGFVENIVIFKLDRLTRSIIDLNNLIKELNQNDCDLHSCTENIDTTTASGRMMINLIGTFAQWESETISERVSVNMQTLAEEGIWQSKTPYGFYLGEDKHLKINKEEQSIFTEACKLILGGISFSQAEIIINNKYNLNWNNGFILDKVRSPTTAGNIIRNGKITKNTHPPLIEENMHKKLLEIAEARSYSRAQTFTGDLFRQKIICPDCGIKLSVMSTKKNKEGKNIYHYRCHTCYKNKRKFFMAAESVLLQAFRRHISEINISYGNIDQVKTNDDKVIKKLQRQLAKAEEKKRRLQKAWIEGYMKDEELLSHQNEIDEEVLEIEENLKKMNKTPTLTSDEVRSLQTTLKEEFEIMNDEERIGFIQQFIRGIYVKRELVKGYKRKYNVDVTGIEFY